MKRIVILIIVILLCLSCSSSKKATTLVPVSPIASFDTKTQRYVYTGKKSDDKNTLEYWEFQSVKRENEILDSLENVAKKNGQEFKVFYPDYKPAALNK